jgi:hypothetical protein
VEIINRINSVNKLYYARNRVFIKRKEQKIFNRVYVPVLTYVCEKCRINTLKSKIQACEMKYVRAVAHYITTKRDHIRNTDIR